MMGAQAPPWATYHIPVPMPRAGVESVDADGPIGPAAESAIPLGWPTGPLSCFLGFPRGPLDQASLAAARSYTVETGVVELFGM